MITVPLYRRKFCDGHIILVLFCIHVADNFECININTFVREWFYEIADFLFCKIGRIINLMHLCNERKFILILKKSQNSIFLWTFIHIQILRIIIILSWRFKPKNSFLKSNKLLKIAWFTNFSLFSLNVLYFFKFQLIANFMSSWKWKFLVQITFLLHLLKISDSMLVIYLLLWWNNIYLKFWWNQRLD